jgi:uncharacterized protein YqeY
MAYAALYPAAMDYAETLQARIRAELKIAMRGRRDAEVATLRSLLAAIDNAQAVPVDGRHDKYAVHAFGADGVEVPRLLLSPDGLEALLRRERDERLAAADEMEALGRSDRALALGEEARVVARFLSPG